MGILITGILGIIISLWCALEATKRNLAFIDKPDWIDCTLAGLWQFAFVAVVYVIEMYLFIKLVENSENIPSIYNFTEFMKFAIWGFILMFFMYAVATGYAIGAKLKSEH